MQQHGIPLSEVAARLGVSTDVVRKRVKRGSLPAYKGADGRWYAVLDGQDGRAGQSGQAELDAGRTVQVTVSSPAGTDDHTREVAVLRDFLASKEHEIDFLREEMGRQREQYAEESRRKDVIIHELSTQLKALPAAILEKQEEQTKQAPESPVPVSHGSWWRFWEWR